jgi:hypothetical protein
MYKNRRFKQIALLFIAIFSFVSCKKDLTETSPTLIASLSNVNTILSAKGGQTITIMGKNLLSSGQSPTIMLNAKHLNIAYSSNDSIKVVIPKLIGSGKITITEGDKTYQGPSFTYQYVATVTTLAGTGDAGTSDGANDIATFNCPWGITADLNGDLYIADVYNRLIRKITAATNQVSSISFGSLDFDSPYNIALDTKKHDLYVTDFNIHLAKIAADGSQSVIYTGAATTTGIAFGPDGFLYLSNNNLGTILKLTPDGQTVTNFSSGIGTPRNIIFNSNNTMFVAGYNVATASAGIFQVDNTGNATFVLPDKAFGGWEIAADTYGDFYEADHFNNVIRLIDPNGNAMTIAGNGQAADVDGIGLAASFNGPQGLTIDSNGNLYVTTYNYNTKGGNKVRKIVVE